MHLTGKVSLYTWNSIHSAQSGFNHHSGVASTTAALTLRLKTLVSTKPDVDHVAV